MSNSIVVMLKAMLASGYLATIYCGMTINNWNSFFNVG